MDQAPGSSPESQGAHGLPSCYRHPGRETGITCTRCERPICTECMISASVGFQCPECVRSGSGTGHGPSANQPRTIAGGTIAADSFLVTKILIGINLAVFVMVLALGPRFVDRTELIGYAISPRLVEIIGLADGEWYRLFTSMFVHQEVAHIAFNMLALWFLGRMVEPALGRSRFLALYLVSGLGGDALVYLLENPARGTIGASGAIFGLVGAFAVLARRSNLDMRPVILIIGLNLLITFSQPDQISWEAHIGGLVTGVLLAIGLVYGPREHRKILQAGTFAAVLLVIAVALLLRTVALTG
ncbi:rhomboid family intramembrane serine protease [Streptomyces sp. NPDC004838]